MTCARVSRGDGAAPEGKRKELQHWTYLGNNTLVHAALGRLSLGSDHVHLIKKNDAWGRSNGGIEHGSNLGVPWHPNRHGTQMDGAHVSVARRVNALRDCRGHVGS